MYSICTADISRIMCYADDDDTSEMNLWLSQFDNELVSCKLIQMLLCTLAHLYLSR